MKSTYPSMFSDKEERPSGKGRFLCFDTEAIGLLESLKYNDPSSMHEIVIKDIFSGEVFVFFDPYDKRRNPTMLQQENCQDGYLVDGLRMLMEAEGLVIQNGFGFDFMAFEKLFPTIWHLNYLERRGKDREHYDYFPLRVMDTLMLSRLLNPDRKAPPQAFAMGYGSVSPHSIEAHGIRIGRFKPENEDWSTLTDHMIHRCEEDVEIGTDYFFWLMNNEWSDHLRRGRNPRTGLGIDSAYRMELQVGLAMERQRQRGFRLDMRQAWEDYCQLGKKIECIKSAISPYIPPRLVTEPFKLSHINNRCAAFSKAYPDSDVSWLRNHLTMYSVKDGARIGKRTTVWKLTTAKGDYLAAVKKDFPEMVGSVNDTKNPLVVGAYTPLTYEDIGLGNLDYVKEHVLYPRGWLGVNYSESEEAFLEETGELPQPWSGKIDEKSLKAWLERDPNVPTWLHDIVSFYVYRSRRSQILNEGDLEYYEKNGTWKKQPSGRKECRGLIPRAFCKEHNMSAQEYYEKMGCFPMDEDEEWRVPAEAFSIGTNTFRMRHKYVVNIPSRGLHPLRHLFIAGKGKKILGCDGSGLELRMLAHFMNDEEYTAVVLDGDIHSYNQEMAGLPKRDMAKTFIYAFLYGSGVPNLAKVCGVSIDEMRNVIKQFKAKLPSLAKLIEGCENAGKEYGYLQAIDARWGRIRKSGRNLLVHTVLNVLLQMTGSLCMKYGLCFAENQMIKEGIGLDESGYPMFIANVHDEVQMEIPEDEILYMQYVIPASDWKKEEKAQYIDSDGRMWSAPSIVEKTDEAITVSRSYHRCGEILAKTMEETGRFLKLRIPLAGEYKIGDSWHDTH